MPLMKERIHRAPKGSRLRDLFDSSDSEEESAAADPSSQTTWTGSQPPPGIQTQEISSYSIPRKVEHERKDAQPKTPKIAPQEILIIDTPNTAKGVSPSVRTAAVVDTVKQVQDLGPLQRQLMMTDESPRKKKTAPRVSLSPPATINKSRVNGTNKLSSLEALAPPPPPMLNQERKKKKGKVGEETVGGKRQSSSSLEDIPVKRSKLNDEMDGPPKKKMKKRKDETQVEGNAAAMKMPQQATTTESAKTMKTDTKDAVDASKPQSAKKAKKRKTKAAKQSIETETTKRPKAKQATTRRTSPRKAPETTVLVGAKTSSKLDQGSKDEKKNEAKSTSEPVKPKQNQADLSGEKQKQKITARKSAQKEKIPEGKELESVADTNKGKDATAAAATKSVKSKPKKKRTFQDQVLAEMLFSCKAYNLKTLSQALNTTEIALQHLMLSLLDKKIVIKKSFTSKTGKVKELYWANQDSKAKDVVKLFPTLEEQDAARQEIAALRKVEIENERELAILTQELSNEEVDAQLQEMETALGEAKKSLVAVHTRIREFKEQKKNPQRTVVNRFQKPKSAAQLAKERCPRRTKMRINAMRSDWKSRKDKCMDFVDQLADGMEKKPKDVIKLLEIETDAMEGVTMPFKLVIEP